MLQPPTTTTSRECDDSNVPLQEQEEEVTVLNSALDEAGWQALLIRIDQEEGGP